MRAPKAKHEQRWGDDDRLPVTYVSWFEACLYSRWLEHWRQQDGSPLRSVLSEVPDSHRFALPTEAQWEFMTRAGTITRFWSGDAAEDLMRVGWSDENSEGRVHAVAELEASPWGLFDVHGDVWEWCRDWYSGELPGGVDPLAAESGRVRAYRGGSYWFSARQCRSAIRICSYGFGAGAESGFRLVLSAPERASNLEL